MVLLRLALCSLLATLFCLPTAAHTATLRGVRFGQHGTVSRIVFDLPQDVAYRLEGSADPTTLRIVFPTLTLPPTLSRLQARDPLVREIRLSTQGSAVIADIFLKAPGTIQQQSRVSTPPRLVLDLARHHADSSLPTPSTSPEDRHAAPPGAPEPERPQTKGPQPLPHASIPTQPSPPPAVPLGSLSAAQLLERAEKYWAERQIDAAQRAYTTFLQRFPEHPNNHLIAARIADILREHQHPRAALEAYTAVLQGYPGSEGALISQIRLAELGMAFPDLLPPGDEPRYAAYRQPLPTMQRLISEYPFSPFAEVARFKIGELLLRQQELTPAIESFEDLLGRTLPDPLRQDVSTSLRQALVQLMASHQQRGAFLEVLRTFFTHKHYLRPTDTLQSDLLLPVALSYAQLGLLDEAQSLFNGLLPRLTDPAQQANLAFEQALRFAKQGQYQNAAALLTPLDRFPEPTRRAQALHILLQDAWQARRLDDTIRYGQQSLELLTEPSARTATLALLGAAYEVRGEPEQARHVLAQCAAIATEAPSSALGQQPEACLVHAVALQARSGQPSQLMAAYEHLLQTFPKGSDTEASLFRLADLHRQQGDTAQMLATFQRLKDSTSTTFWHKVAAEYLDQAQWQERLQERLAAFQNSLMR